MTREEAIEIINTCLAMNVEVTFVESKIDAGHMVRIEKDNNPIQMYSVALSRILTIRNEDRLDA
jgi:hypothetical protein